MIVDNLALAVEPQPVAAPSPTTDIAASAAESLSPAMLTVLGSALLAACGGGGSGSASVAAVATNAAGTGTTGAAVSTIGVSAATAGAAAPVATASAPAVTVASVVPDPSLILPAVQPMAPVAVVPVPVPAPIPVPAPVPVPAPAPAPVPAPAPPAPAPATAPAPTPSPPPAPNPAAPGFNNTPKALTDPQAARFLLQSQLEATTGEIIAVRGTTYAAYLQQQFAKPIGQTGYQWLEARGYGASDIRRYFFSTYPADFMIWNQLFTASDSMRKRCALALSEFFVVSLSSAEFNWRSHAFGQYWDLLVGSAFGNFRKLLEDISLNPAMGYFLNTKGNQKENTTTGRVPDENYAREVMQLLTIGVDVLNLDGSVQTSGGKKLESYTQSDVTNLARVFTGYDFDTSDGVRITPLNDDGTPETYTIESRGYTQKPMSLNASRHSTLATTFLGTTIPGNTPGAAALKTALDTLFNHPNVGPFFGKQMIQRLVTSNPSPAYVARVAAAFNNNGASVRGDLKAVWTAILLDDEARGAGNLASTTFGKLREPMLRFIQWGRSFGLNSAANSWKMFDTSGASDKLGQSPLRAPSVFNFFRPGFIPPSTALAATQSPAPEFQLVNETTVGGYLNYMQNVMRSGIYAGDPGVPFIGGNQTYVPDITASYTQELALVANAAALVDRINLILCAGQLSATNQATIVAALNGKPVTATSPANEKLDRVCAAILMVMATPDYLIQK